MALTVEQAKALAEKAWVGKDYEPEDGCSWGLLGGAEELLKPVGQEYVNFKVLFEAAKAVGFDFIICYADYGPNELADNDPQAPILAGKLKSTEPTVYEDFNPEDEIEWLNYGPWVKSTSSYLCMGFIE